MQKPFHFCFSSPGEVLFRDEEDHIYYFNAYAQALFATGSKSMADCEMSNHCHHVILSERPARAAAILRISYTKYYNHKYFRSGPLGEKGVFLRELDGNAQLVVALSYVLRQPVHHGVSHSPFNYPFSSINCYFREELGKNEIVRCVPDAMVASYLPRRAAIPPTFKMGYNGMFKRESVTEHRLTELQYGTYGTFSFYMTRRSSEQWREEQLRNNAGVQPLVLGDIEEGLLAHDPEGAASLRTMQSNESKKFLLPANDDLALCKIIDRTVLHEFRLPSVYQLADGQRAKLAQRLLTQHHAHMDQIRRCLYFK